MSQMGREGCHQAPSVHNRTRLYLEKGSDFPTGNPLP